MEARSDCGQNERPPAKAKVACMRELTPDDLGVLLSFFVVLLIFFSVDFHIVRKRGEKATRPDRIFAIISAVGGVLSALALLLTWVAMFLPDNVRSDDVPMVFIPGTISIVCAAVLSLEVVAHRVRRMKD